MIARGRRYGRAPNTAQCRRAAYMSGLTRAHSLPMVVKGEWLGFLCGLAVLYFEILSIRRILIGHNRQK